MTVEELVKVLDKEVVFEVYQAYNRGILFNSSSSYRDGTYNWDKVKNMIVSEFYPTDVRELYIYVVPDWDK